MSDSENVEEIMSEIKKKIGTSAKSGKITIENIIEVAASRANQRRQKLRDQISAESDYFHYLESLNLMDGDKLILTASDNIIKEELHNANLSVGIQVHNKIDTGKPKIIKKLVLKIRHILQNEVRFALDPVVNNQIRFNSHAVRVLNGIINWKEETKDEINTLKTNHDELRSELKTNHDELRSELKTNHDELRSELKTNHDELRSELKTNQNQIEAVKDQSMNLWDKLVSIEISRGYNELLHRDPVNEEVNEYKSRILGGEFTLDNFRDVLKRSKEYQNILEDKKLQEIIIMKKIHERIEYLHEMDDQNKLKTPNALAFVNFQNLVRSHTNPFLERHVEYLWLLKNMPTKGILLDVGCADSALSNELSRIKGLRVFGVDIRKPTEKISYEFHQEDATRMSFSDEFFDIVAVVSSIEHFGLDVYGGKILENADQLAMNEIKRVLKPQGILFLTVPVGRNQKSWSRVYNGKSIEKLLKGFKILQEKYYVQEDIGWIETSKENAESNEGAKYRQEEISSGAIACIMAIKL